MEELLWLLIAEEEIVTHGIGAEIAQTTPPGVM
jgi:hypothetical protein